MASQKFNKNARKIPAGVYYEDTEGCIIITGQKNFDRKKPADTTADTKPVAQKTWRSGIIIRD